MIDAPLPRPVPGRLSGRIAVVTAAASGIGRATAIRVAAEGATVIDRDPRVAETRSGITSSGGTAESMELDCSNRAAVEEAFASIAARHGRIDILVNGVGRSAREKMTDFWNSDPDTWDMVIAVSLKSTMLCSRQVVAGMRERRSGRIINISSTAWLTPTPFFHDYAAAKAGVVGFTRVLAMELAPYMVTANSISPGPIMTPALAPQPPGVQERIKALIPLGDYGAPEDIAAGVCYLAADDGRFITGHNLIISGGRGMV
jgi:NAD(P)-dependent dehydrogenase (short-subunit alcohol dehydrogenase family)